MMKQNAVGHESKTAPDDIKAAPMRKIGRHTHRYRIFTVTRRVDLFVCEVKSVLRRAVAHESLRDDSGSAYEEGLTTLNGSQGNAARVYQSE